MKQILAIAALGLVAACAQPFQARVQSFQAMPPERGQTFFVKPAEGATEAGLEFAAYSNLVVNELRKQGFQQAATAEAAQLQVLMDYGTGPARERISTRPSLGPSWSWYGSRWYGRYPGYWGPWYDPWDRQEVYSFTVYPSFLHVAIVKTDDKSPVFEGRAETTTRVNDMPATMPNLVAALFADFPGEAARSKVVKVPAK